MNKKHSLATIESIVSRSQTHTRFARLSSTRLSSLRPRTRWYPTTHIILCIVLTFTVPYVVLRQLHISLQVQQTMNKLTSKAAIILFLESQLIHDRTATSASRTPLESRHILFHHHKSVLSKHSAPMTLVSDFKTKVRHFFATCSINTA